MESQQLKRIHSQQAFAKVRGKRRALELVNRVLIESNTRLLVIMVYARKTRSLKGIVEGEEALEIRIRSREESRESQGVRFSETRRKDEEDDEE